MFRRFMSLVLTVSLLVVGVFAAVPAPASAATLYIRPLINATQITTPLNPKRQEIVAIDKSQYYGRQLLVKSGNTAFVSVYDRIAAGVDQYNTNFCVASFHIALEDFNKILNYYIYDHPEAFWFNRGQGSSIYYTWESNMLGGSDPYTYMRYTLTESKADIIARREQMDARVDELLGGLRWTESGTPTANGLVRRYWTPLAREQEIFNRLHNSVIFSYAENNPHRTDLTSALLDTESQSAGIASAFQYLMYQNGIECILVRGTWQYSLHVWCMVKIDGNWKMVDPSLAARHPLDTDDYFNFEYADMSDLGYTSIDMYSGYFPFAEA